MAVGGLEHRFGPYGGQYVPETLMPALAELEAAWIEARDDAGYRGELAALTASLSVRAPASTGITVVPSSPMRCTLGAWRRMSSVPM